MSLSSETNSTPASTKSAIAKDEDGNEITLSGKIFSGVLLAALTTISTIVIIGFWPDRLPAPKESIKPLYTNKIFHVNLVGIPDTARMRYEDENSGTIAEKTGIVAGGDTTFNTTDSTDTSQTRATTIKKKNSPALYHSASPASGEKYPPESKLLHINTILLILVAAGGFLGNILYISTSFTTFIGAGKFKRSWTLWYCVKPFTAAGLALTIYFVFRGGFLNMSDNSTNINIYGVLTISLLAGLFTDRTTLKLKEVFDVLLKPKEERPDSLEGIKPKITDIKPKDVKPGETNLITLVGENLNTGKLSIIIEGEKVKIINKSAKEIELSYLVPETLKEHKELKISVLNEKDEEVYHDVLKVKE